jgi:type IV pilus assembly protein PilM
VPITLDALDFDPYRAWLNITDEERPVSPYRLLALAPLESDPNRIRAGYLRQQSAMLLHAERADPEVWGSVNQEIEEAYSLLCDSEQKAVLDATIRRKTGSGPNGHVAVPSAAAGLTVACRHCQRTSPATKRFCGGCGKSLWETCPNCQSECAADERFCGSCGADILVGLGEQSRRLQTKLAEAEALIAVCRYDEALGLLRSVAAVADPRFERWAQQALAAIAQADKESAERQAAANKRIVSARVHLESHEFEAAIKELDAIPVPIRTPEATALLERARGARQESLTLTAEIRTALDDGRTIELLPKIERLLTLKPDHAQARQLAEKMRDRLVRSAKKRFHAQQYRECLDELAQLPLLLRTAEADAMAETAGELLALLDGIRGAALADRPTLALADRLVKLAPANEEAAKTRTRLAERLEESRADPRLGAANFAPLARQTSSGWPVDWLAHAGRFQPADESVQSAMHEQPGQLFVALGLALQGLGLAAVPIDLSPADQTNVLQRPLFVRKSGPVAWGLDLSDYALKAVKLTKESKDSPVKVAAVEYILHRKSLVAPGMDVERPELLEETLRDFVSRVGDLSAAKICVGLAGQRVLGRFFDVPPIAAKKLPDAITFEARHQLPIALDELCWGHQVLDIAGKNPDQSPRRIVVTAARQPHVRERLSVFKSAGINVDQFQSDCVALHNVLVFDLLNASRTAGPANAVCVLDIGTDSTNVVISSPTTVWFRTFGQGGNSFTSALVKQFNLTHQQAEQIKREPAKARRYGQMCDTLRPIFVQLAGEIERSLANYGKLFPEHPVQQIFGLGGAFQTHGLLRHLRFGK